MKIYSYLKNRARRLKWQEWCLLVCLVIGGFLRLYKLENAMFQGDQGRDALIVSQIFRDKNLVFIGPVTSIGNMYLGPLYYYFMLPFLMLTFPSPIGPVYAVALLSTALIFCIYVFGRKMVGETAALFAAILLTFSSIIIDFSRYSWNPNPAPFVGFFLLYGTFRAIKDEKYWLLVAVCASVLLQLHYVTLLACAAAGLVWLFILVQKVRSGHSKNFFLMSALAALLVLLSFVPLVLFDSKHGWLNAKAGETILTSSENFGYASTYEKYSASIQDIGNKVKLLFFEMIFRMKSGLWWPLSVGGVAIVVIGSFFKKKKETHKSGVLVLLVFITVTAIGLALYRHSVFDHYVIYILPVVFLSIGWILEKLWRVPFLGKAGVLVYLSACIYAQVNHYSFRPAGPTFNKLAEASREIQKNIQPNERYILILLSESHDVLGMNYRYFLSVEKDKQPVEPGDHGQAEKLVIINEEKKTDAPWDLPIYEIVTFPSKVPKSVLKIPQGPDIYIFERAAKK